MTLNVALGTHSPATFSKTGERGGKTTGQEDRGFSDALSEKTTKRGPARNGVQSDETASRPSWKLDGYLAGLPELDFDAPLADEPEAGQFGAVLEELLNEGNEAVLEGAVASGDGQSANIVLDGDALDDIPAVVAKVESEPVSVQVDTEDAAPAQSPITEQDGLEEVSATRTQNGAAVETLAASTTSALSGAPRTATAERPVRGSRDGAPQQQGAVAPERTAGDSRQPASSGTAQPDAVTRPGSSSAIPETGRFTPARDAIRPSNADTPPKNAPASPDPLAGRVNVLGFTAALAPSPATTPLLSSTATGVVAVMESDPTWRAAALEGNAGAVQRGANFSAGVNTLRIQLHPVELGMITARLTASGSQLSVEIQVESNDARQKLTNDSEAILKALRAVGYDVEKVTIQQGPQNTSGSAQQGSSGREQFMPNQQAQGDGSTKGQGGQPGGRTQDSERTAHGSGETPADRAGSTLYI